MSLLASLPPTLVAATGVILAGLPFAKTFAGSSASLALLQGVNVAAFAFNCFAVSVPGRIDEQQDQNMRRAALNPATGQQGSETTPLTTTYDSTYSPARGRTMVAPAGWAFSIWGPIYCKLLV